MKIDKGYLDDLKKGAVMSGRLSEIHIKNLQMYPFIYFDDVRSVDIDYNIDLTKESNSSYVNFDIKTNKKRAKIKNIKIRLETLSKSIETLLWSGISISVYINGKELKDV